MGAQGKVGGGIANVPTPCLGPEHFRVSILQPLLDDKGEKDAMPLLCGFVLLLWGQMVCL